MARGLVDRIVVGADRIAANGDVANKIGTYPLAVLAARHEIPFYVAAPLSTLDPRTAIGGGHPDRGARRRRARRGRAGAEPRLRRDARRAGHARSSPRPGVLEPPYEEAIAAVAAR